MRFSMRFHVAPQEIGQALPRRGVIFVRFGS
jgi:hypothetical protein